MHDTSDGYLMMIEPKSAVVNPIEDELTALAQRVGGMAVATTRYRGFHRCVCGAVSDNQRWELPDGRVTNSLLLHYVMHHRDEVPVGEIEKLRGYGGG